MESTKFQTFFDIGLNGNIDKPFAKLVCVNYTEKNKKRVINNGLVKRYFNNDNLSKEELIRVKKILDGSIYSDRRKMYDHCKLCSKDFERETLINFTQKYKYWEICKPTFPYFPFGLMIYLKNREDNHIENVQDLPNDYINELIDLENDLLCHLQKGFLGNELVGINILFNQISKSELCIHGHVELMIKDVDTKDLGYSYVLERPYDRFVSNINKQMPNDNLIMKIPEGIKLNYYNFNNNDIKLLMKMYENTINYYFKRGKDLQNNIIKINKDEDVILKSNMIPAVVDYVYFTLYDDNLIISMVPSITSEFVSFDNVRDDPIELYSLIINRYYTNKDNIFMKNFSPLVRPSIKVCDKENNNDKIKKLEKKIFMELEK